MIADYSTGEDIDFDFLQELINEQKQPKDLRMHISDGNKIITYRECVDLLNKLVEENERLKKQNEKLNIDFMNFKTNLIEKLQIHYSYAKEQKQKNLNDLFVAKAYDIILHDVKKLANEIGADLMTKTYSHRDCEYYIEKYDACSRFKENNMSQRTRLCECSMRNGDFK